MRPVILTLLAILLSLTVGLAEESTPWYEAAPPIAYNYLCGYLQIEPELLSKDIPPDSYDAGRISGDQYINDNGKYWEVVFYSDVDGQKYKFVVVIDENTKQLVSITRREQYQQLALQKETGNYTNWWIAQLAEREKQWGDARWWTYEQRYVFQRETYGWGIPGALFTFSMPNSYQISYDRAYEITNGLFTDAYQIRLEPDLVVGSAFIDHENSNHEYFIPKRLALNAFIDRWEFLVVDADHDEVLLYVLIDAYSGRSIVNVSTPIPVLSIDLPVYWTGTP